MFHQYYEEIIHYLLRGTCWKGATDVERNTISRRAAKYKVINGVLYHKGKGRGIEDFRLVATTVADQQNAIRMCHISEVDDRHFGINKTASLLASRYYWRMMYTDVIKFIDKCPKCKSQEKAVVTSQCSPQDEKMSVWRMLEVDVLDNFIIIGKRAHHLLRLVDVHSSWSTFVILEDSSERTAVRALFKECSILGFPLAFRFVRPGVNYLWTNSFISALHQELDGFSSFSGGQQVDTSVHVALEDDNPSWNREHCIQICQEVIIENPSALYIFFGCNFLVDQRVRDWYSEKVQQFIKDEPFWWPQRLSSFLFHLRNDVPPGMTTSPSALLSSGVRDENPIFMPLRPEKITKKEELVAYVAPKEYLAQSCFLTGKVNKPAEKPVISEKNIKESQQHPINNKSSVKRKAESVKTSSHKRPHSTSYFSASSIPIRSKEDQRKIDKGILEALDEAISKGIKDVEKQKKKKKKSSKKDNNHSSTGLFDMTGPLVSTPSHAPALDMAMSSSMSSLEALKAVTGSSIPPSVPPSPLLPSAILSPTTPEGDSPAPPHEEASPGRYSFRQNLKPKGTSNFIRRLIAKTSSKRYTGTPEITVTELQPNWPVFPPKKVAPKSPVKSPPPESVAPLTNTHQPQEPIASHSPVVLSTQLSEDLLPTDFEPNCSLGLSKAEEDLIDQTIKGVDQNGFMDPVKYVGDDVLTVEDISKEELSSMEVSDSDTLNVSNTNSLAVTRTDFNVSNSSVDVTNKQKGDISINTIDSDLNTSEESAELNEVGVSDEVFHGLPQNQSLHLDNSRKESSSSEMDKTEGHLILEDSNDSGGVAADTHSEIEPSFITDQTEEAMDTSVMEDVEVCAVSVDDVNSFDHELTQVEPGNSAVIFDVLDTCATFEVGEKAGSLEISNHVEDDEEDIELVTQKISKDLASGLTIDKTKTAQGELNLNDNALTDEESIIASACNALLNMATVTNFAAGTNSNTTCPTQVPATSCATSVNTNITYVVKTECDRTTSTVVSKDPQMECVTDNKQESAQDGTDLKLEDSSVAVPAVVTSTQEPSEMELADNAEGERDFESELCLPSDFFLDEALLESPEKKSEVKSVKKCANQNKLMADQDIVSILNSIMSNRAFMDDPVARAQREKFDRELKDVHGLTKDIKVKLSHIAEPVVQRAVLGPVPVRTIRTNDRRAYYIGNMKIDEYKCPPLAPVSPSPIVSVTLPMGGGKSAQVFLPKSALPMQAVKKFQTILKPALPKPVPVSQPQIGKPKPIIEPSIMKKGKKPLGCPICPRTYAISQEMLDLHVGFHIDNARNLHCPVCGRAATVWTNVLKHYAGHPEAKENASLYEMILATIDKDRKLCGQCNTLFALRNALIQHLQSSHKGEKSNKNIQVRLLETVHIKKDPPVPPPPCVKTTSDAKDINYLCPYCAYSTKTHYNLVLHSHECQGKGQKTGDPLIKVLEDLSPQLQCGLCSYATVSSKQLEQHMRLLHNGSNRVPAKLIDLKQTCDFCPLKFKTVDQLRCHLMKHKEAILFSCKVCNYKCRYKKIMHRHFHKMHPDKSMKGLILAPKKFTSTTLLRLRREVQDMQDSDSEPEDEEENEDTGIPTATVVVHTDENGELMVCDENDASNIPLEPEESFVYDPSATGANTVTIEGSAVTLDGNVVTIDGNAVTLDGNAVTLDGNMLQILQEHRQQWSTQSVVLSVGPEELESFNSTTFTITEEANNS